VRLHMLLAKIGTLHACVADPDMLIRYDACISSQYFIVLASSPPSVACAHSDIRPSNAGLVSAVFLATDGYLQCKETNAAATLLLLRSSVACAQLRQGRV